MEPENIGRPLGPNGGGPNARPPRMSAPGTIPYESKLTSSLAIQTPVSSTVPLEDFRVKVPVAVTDLLGVLNAPAPLIS
jgi:hypothetical protein